LFDPRESIDFNGHTGPFIQYTHARICSLQRRAEDLITVANPNSALHPKEKDLLKVLLRYPEAIQEAATDYSPAVLANYAYELVKEYNQFYQQVPIFGVASEQDKAFRIGLSGLVGNTIASAMKLLGITVPQRM